LSLEALGGSAADPLARGTFLDLSLEERVRVMTALAQARLEGEGDDDVGAAVRDGTPPEAMRLVELGVDAHGEG
jgi:hypothetical protein